MNQMTFGVLSMTPKEFQQRLGISDDEMWTLTQKFVVTPQEIAALERKIAAHRGCAMMWKEDYRKLLSAAIKMVGAVRDQHGLWAKYGLADYPGTNPLILAARDLYRLLE